MGAQGAKNPPQQFPTDSSVSTWKEGRLSFFHAFLTICSLSIFPCQHVTNTGLSSTHFLPLLMDLLTLYRTRHFIFFSFIFISWKLITLQNCSGFCHTLTYISHGFTCRTRHFNSPSELHAWLAINSQRNSLYKGNSRKKNFFFTPVIGSSNLRQEIIHSTDELQMFLVC